MELLVDRQDEDRCRVSRVNDFDLAWPVWKSETPGGGVAVPQNPADRLIAEGYGVMRVRSMVAGSGSANLNPVVWRRSARRPHRVILAKEKSP